MVNVGNRADRRSNTPEVLARYVDKRDPRWEEVSGFLNKQFGLEFIQHGSQYLYEPGDFDPVLAFAPDGKERRFWGKGVLEHSYATGAFVPPTGAKKRG